MSRPFPYSYISCPCTDVSTSVHGRDSYHKTAIPEDADEEERTFDPRSPRANYSLYPVEHLLYCEDCHQIKCPRCVTEEIVCYFCPNCLFETPTSMVRTELNRCARNCFNCPVCTSPLTVNTLDGGEGGGQQGPWILVCGYCMWTTLDLNIKFDKPTNIRQQLAKLTSHGASRMSKSESQVTMERKSSLSISTPADEESNPTETTSRSSKRQDEPLDPAARFAALKSFYRNQIAETTSTSNDPLFPGYDGSGSPGALNRIMSIYTNNGLGNLYNSVSKRTRAKPAVMREALSTAEGFQLPASDTSTIITQMSSPETGGWDNLVSPAQRTPFQQTNRFTSSLLPEPTLLRTKRAKRCKSCKHILVKPEFKPQSTRFRIRLIALNYIPLITLRPLILPQQQATQPTINLSALQSHRPHQFLLTMKNHMFDPIHITLATPSTTPGRVANRVTILCPQFDVGANSDVWDEALQGNGSDAISSQPSSRTGRPRAGTEAGGEKVAEAGKVWEKGRNWTSIVVEVVPGEVGGSKEIEQEGEDADVLEIPVFVRIEWEGEGGVEEGAAALKKEKDAEMVKRELAYWMVLGVGRIRPIEGFAR